MTCKGRDEKDVRDERLVDLSLLVDESLPSYWPTHMPFQRHVWNWYSNSEKDDPQPMRSNLGPYFTEWLLLDEHTGTHFDAPAHFISGNGRITGEQIPMAQFHGPAVVIDVSHIRGSEPGVSPVFDDKVVTDWEKDYRPIVPDDIVIFRTDWDRDYYRQGNIGKHYAFDVLVTKLSPGWPAPNEQCMQALLDRKVQCVGTDAPSMGSSHDGVAVHRLGLGAGMVYIEGLANLDQLPPTGATFLFLPIKIAQSSGGMGRAIGWLP